MLRDTRVVDASLATSANTQPTHPPEKTCEELGAALDDGKIGDIVAKHEQLILHYYQDVQEQARQSFTTARSVATVGFIVLIGTVVYALIFDGLTRFKIAPEMTDGSVTVAGIGLVSGALIEFIAAIAFWLYSRGAKQFGAFHICLERTHRYLLAYKITEQMKERRDETLKDLVCIMAKAQMITRNDINAANSNRVLNPEPASAQRS
jgi:hypothetical protein